MKKDKKKKVIIICPHPENVAPNQRLKYEQYFDYLRANNVEITVRPFISEKFNDIIYKKGFVVQKIFWTLAGYLQRFITLFSLRRYDVVYIVLWVTPFGPPVFEWLYVKFSKKVIFDIDDLIFLPNKSQANSLIAGIKGRTKPIYLMKKADHVITCTPYLDKFVRKYNQNTTDISSTINTLKYKPKKDYSINGRKAVLGWSGSHSTARFLYWLAPVLKKLSEKGVPFKLRVMGDESFHIDGVDIEAIPWKEKYEIEEITNYDIGLYPLPDEEWVYGKSGLKALQYMAAGVPTIASAVGTIFRIIDNGINGFLVKDEEEWINTIQRLVEDESLRERIGKKGCEIVEERFSVDANKEKYLAILEETIG